ncbi:hypothetical protein B1F79_03225 [Coxiella-like endosymbiont of Rhipicephalus sanguineus]|uniref:YciI family protein n=1 Tax=Coxiella-like endosymbiont of Rhipicephalus sanguineus TaxID=1955402 RepID=UPI002042442A|nr:YciI family protein [Coxiella-like endosymbiont of Rhipicephalus sanguineus]MBT8506571.1 hypothetical protein [Coxiella-like endosymbiont of Rhipicephalus sanguineus]
MPIYCKNQEDSFERRRSVRPTHLQRLEELRGQNRLFLVGPLLNIEIKGSLIVAEFANLSAAKEWAAADPYVTANVYSRVIVYPFKKLCHNY